MTLDEQIQSLADHHGVTPAEIERVMLAHPGSYCLSGAPRLTLMQGEAS